MERTVLPATRVSGSFRMPGDKSIGHRSLLLTALADGSSRIAGLPASEDVNSTRRCLTSLGIDSTDAVGDGTVVVQGRGPRGLTAPSRPLDAGNSGTTARLLLGVLAAQPFDAVLDGDESLRRRPMARVTTPLTLMGARFSWLDAEGCLPVQVHGMNLHFAELASPVASAQVKSALLLAGLCSGRGCTVREGVPTRNHTELLLAAQGVQAISKDGIIRIAPGSLPRALSLRVPGDISSAAFFIAAAALVQGSCVTIEEVGLNPGRTGLLTVLQAMGAAITTSVSGFAGGEPVGTIVARYAPLQGISLRAEAVPAIVDELPLLAVLAMQARGRTLVTGAAELRVKESDRIAATAAGLRALGAAIEELPDGFAIDGPQQLRGGSVDSCGDHRIAMAFAVAALAASGPVTVRGAESVAVSFPQFWEFFAELVQDA